MAGKNQKTIVKLKRLHPDAVLPERATVGSSGFDLVAVEEAKIAGGGSRALISTGIAMEIPKGYEGQVRPRSGNALKLGLSVLNSPGTIDSDYRGEIKVILANFGPFHTVKPGDRVAQLVIQRVPDVDFVTVEDLTDTERGAGGFGSTGQ